MKALIAGGGTGGLTTALFLHNAGIEVEIFERASAIRELGVGINLLPHAVKELARLQLISKLDAEGIRTRELIYANRFGQVVWRQVGAAGAMREPFPHAVRPNSLWSSLGISIERVWKRGAQTNGQCGDRRRGPHCDG